MHTLYVKGTPADALSAARRRIPWWGRYIVQAEQERGSVDLKGIPTTRVVLFGLEPPEDMPNLLPILNEWYCESGTTPRRSWPVGTLTFFADSRKSNNNNQGAQA